MGQMVKRPSNRDKTMIGAIEDRSARGLAKWLVLRERLLSGKTEAEARQAVAFAARIAPGTVENLFRDRLRRGVDLLRDRLCAVVIAELEAERARHEHELAILKASRRRFAVEEMAEVEAGLAALDAALVQERRAVRGAQ